jgi:hypothetical protein
MSFQNAGGISHIDNDFDSECDNFEEGTLLEDYDAIEFIL